MTSKPNNIIWTAAGIARYLGCGEDYVRRTLAREPDTPIRMRGRRLYAFDDELAKFMRSPRSKANKPVR